SGATLQTLDDDTRELIRLAAVVAAGDEDAMRSALARLPDSLSRAWVDELLLQTYLFAGFPRALNAMREWRRISPHPAGGSDRGDGGDVDAWRRDGEATCAAVYGAMYERLRHNVRDLHPALDEWMIVEGYGKVLSRPGLDLGRRELCVVAACAAARQDRQLHSHLHGALNVGVPVHVIDAAIAALADLLGPEHARSVELLWARVRGK